MGFELDTIECTIRVPIDKYEQTMDLMRAVISEISLKLEISTLERIRVSKIILLDKIIQIYISHNLAFLMYRCCI